MKMKHITTSPQLKCVITRTVRLPYFLLPEGAILMAIEFKSFQEEFDDN